MGKRKVRKKENRERKPCKWMSRQLRRTDDDKTE